MLMVWVLKNEVAAKIAFEAIDVENGVYVFYAEDGTWLKPNFAQPIRRGLLSFLLRKGSEYYLERVPERAHEVDIFEVAIAKASGVEPNPYFRRQIRHANS
jgi:hypothetical protein